MITRVKNFGAFRRLARIRTVEYEIGPEESVSTAVVRAVSAVEGRELCSLRPLADVVDPTALDSLFDPRDDGTPRTGGRLSFVYNDCCITVDNGEYLTLQLLEGRFCDERDQEPSDSCVR
nr:HalOD1 output domain-containing protein [Halobellus litoreus]